MCRLVAEAIEAGNEQVIQDVRRICTVPEDEELNLKTPQQICDRIFHTCFMGSVNSSSETRSRARDLATDIGAYHTDLNIDSVIKALTDMFTFVTNFAPRFKMQGGSLAENLALQVTDSFNGSMKWGGFIVNTELASEHPSPIADGDCVPLCPVATDRSKATWGR